MVDAIDIRCPRQHAGRQNHFVKLAGQHWHVRLDSKPEVYPEFFEHDAIISERLMKFFLARYALGKVELTTDFAGSFKHCHPVTPLSRHRGKSQAGRPGAYYSNGL